MRNDIERRAMSAEITIETRAEDEDVQVPKIVGHAAVFNSLSEDLGGFREQIAPGAFADSLERGDDVRALFNHSPDVVLGRSRSKTLLMREDGTGLRVEITPPDTTQARDVMTLISRGDVSQMSFGFIVEVDEWNVEDRENVVRTLKQVRLMDVSPVTFPAYGDTDVAVRRLDAVIKEQSARANKIAMLRRRADQLMRKV